MKTYNWLKAVVATVVCLALVATACAAPAPAPPAKEKVIKFGGLFTMTGAMAGWINQQGMGAQDYIRYVQEELGGIEYTTPDGQKDKVKLELLWEDHAWQLAKAISIYERFKMAGVQLLLSSGSVPSSACASFAARDELPGLILGVSTMDPIMYEVETPYILCDGDALPEIFGGAVYYIKSELWKEARPLNLGIIAMDVPTRRVLSKDDVTAKWCATKGVNLSIDYVPMAPVDTSIELKRQADAGCEWILLDLPTGSMPTVFRDAERLGIMAPEGKVNFILSYPQESTMAKTPELFEGLATAGVSSFEEGVPGCDLATRLIEKYHPGATPGIDFGANFYLHSFGDAIYAVSVLKRTLEEVGYENLSGAAVRENLFDCTKPIETMGIKPPIIMDPEWPMKTPFGRYGTVVGARNVLTSKYYEAPPMGFIKPRWNPNPLPDVVTGY